MPDILMKCGCRANATINGKPGCAVHFGLTPDAMVEAVPTPDLTGRMAKCTYCGTMKPSSVSLPFFEYLGPGSRESRDICTCGYHTMAHPSHAGGCKGFTARGPLPEDRYYCGCRGWD